MHPVGVTSMAEIVIEKPIERMMTNAVYSTLCTVRDGNVEETEKMTFAKTLACLVEESSNINESKPRSRMELKRSFELSIKRRVKEQYINGRFVNLMENVIAKHETLHDAYNCVRLNSNVHLASKTDESISFQSMAEELSNGTFDVNANTYSISTKGAIKEVLFLPNLKLKIVQEAIRIVLEVVYRPNFSKISHGCRSGRGHSSTLKYIRKEISNSNWWFTLVLSKSLDDCIFNKLVSTMEETIEDTSLYTIIRSMYNSHVLNLEFGGYPKGHGLPQEGVLSPILMNIYLNLFDHEFYNMSMRYEALGQGACVNQNGPKSNLRSWFRRKLKGSGDEKSSLRIYCCRFMDEILLAVSGSKETAVRFKSEIENYFQGSLYLDVHSQEIFPCDGPHGIRFLGTLIRKGVREGPAVRAVHKLKEKVKLFASQKQEAWDKGTVRIGKKWLAHGLKKVKESEIKHLADSNSPLTQISSFRKGGMKTDHWYKFLLKVWMQDMNARYAESEEIILSKYIAEPVLPQELKDSFYKFQKCVEEYISTETASILALLPNSSSQTESITTTEVIAPVIAIKKRLLRYGLTNYEGYPRACSFLIFQDNIQIIDWFFGVLSRWIRWYSDCDNFSEVKLIISDRIRKSCIRTLAAKHKMHETEIEKKFDSELSKISLTEKMDKEKYDESLAYGIYYSGLCLLSMVRMVSQSRPCCCFVMGCLAAAPSIYSLHVMERQKFPGWATGFSSSIHPSLNRRRIGLCKEHLRDLYLGHISLQSVDFGAWKSTAWK